ncbi:MAG: cobalt-precorrin-6A reductase [Paracoccus sp. (in: a-proteobacteria)]|nr:cobalt-precorrin-6A reductase [Paracoccus sp. (in: a-proteobacteria)]
MRHVLILGGTLEASALARELAARGIRATLSYAGRTESPRAQPVDLRIGGFGGAGGLADWMRAHGVTHLVDATHPFAAQISANAVAASRAALVPLIALSRPAWQAGAGDVWQHVADIAGAVAALQGPARRVFLATGRQNLGDFAAQTQHFYLLRLVDRPEAPPLPDCAVVVDRGPFTVAGDTALMAAHRIDLVVAKNAGGTGASAKLEAARALGLPVLMIDRPAIPARPEAQTVVDVLDWLDHGTDLGV